MRLDNFLVAQGFFDSRTKAKQSIERGEVHLNGKAIIKASFDLDENLLHDVKIICQSSFVSLGGYKMEKALKDFSLSVKDFTVADIGCSTGGFTDCLLKNGVKRVYAVDLNDDLLHKSLLLDERVDFFVKNAKNLSKKDFKTPLDMIVADLSFISVSHVLGVFSSLLDHEKFLLILIKPQFETGEKKMYKNGIIRDEKLHKKICDNVIDMARDCSLNLINMTTTPEVKDKNREFLMLFKKVVKNENE